MTPKEEKVAPVKEEDEEANSYKDDEDAFEEDAFEPEELSVVGPGPVSVCGQYLGSR